MRTWVIIAMMVLLPLQLTWAAVAACCAHDGGPRASYAGHHEYPHAKAGERMDTSDAGKLSTVKVDLDCGTCHAGCPVMASTAAQITVPDASLVPDGSIRSHASAPGARPDRPQWLALA